MPGIPTSDKLAFVEKGQLLLEEKPFVQALSRDQVSKRCDHCYANGELLRCTGCSYVRYCDAECQKAEWINHKMECSKIRRHPSGREIPSTARLIAKIIMKLKKGGDSEKGYYGKNNFRMFKDLMSHYSEMKNNPDRVDHVTTLYAILTDFLGAEHIPNYPEFFGLYGKLVVNGFVICDGEHNTLGTGIYLGGSTIDHSCAPNAVVTYSGTTLRIRALEDIQQYDWSKVRISYVDSLNVKEERIKELWDTYYIECDCIRCEEGENLESPALCQNCSGIVYADKMTCDNCQWRAPDSFISKYKEVMEFSLHQHKELQDETNLDACKLCIEKEEGVLHPSNLVHTKSLDLAFEAAIQMKLFDEAARVGKALVPGYRMYYGDWHPLTGVFLMELGQILLILGNQDSVEVLEEAEKVLRISYGTNDDTYTQRLEPLLLHAKSLV